MLHRESEVLYSAYLLKDLNQILLFYAAWFIFVMLYWFLKELNMEICVGMHGILEWYCVYWLFCLGGS